MWLQGNQGYIGTLGFAREVTIPTTGTYYIGAGSDDKCKLSVDGTVIVDQIISNMRGSNCLNFAGDSLTFRHWFLYPISLTAGVHRFELSATSTVGNGLLGFEVYSGTESELIGVASEVALDTMILFSTKNVANGSAFDIGNYTCADPTYQLVNNGGIYSCQKIVTTTDIQPAIEDITYTCNNPAYTLINDGGVYSCTKVDQVITPIYESSLEFSSNLTNIIEPIKLSFDYLNNSDNTLSSSGFFTSSTNKLVFNIESKLVSSTYSISNIKLNRATFDITPVTLTSFN